MTGFASQYEQDGFGIVHDLLSAAECDRLKTEAARVMREHAAANKTVYVGVSVVSQVYRKLAGDSRIVGLLKTIMPDGVAFMSDKFVVKTATQRFATPWHIDAFYWPSTRAKISVWIPLDDSTEANGTLIAVRGTHRKSFTHMHNDGHKSNGEFNNVLSSRQWERADEVICNVRRGAAIFFSDRLVHGSCASSGGERCAIISTYHAPFPEEQYDQSFPARHILMAKE